MKKLFLYILALVAMLAFIICVTMYRYNTQFFTEASVYDFPLNAAPAEAQPLTYIEPDFFLKEGFTSHLPIIVLDMHDQEPPITLRFDALSGKYVELLFDHYVDGTITVIDNESENMLSSTPAAANRIRIKRRGNSSMLYEKPQYLIKLVSDSGEDVDLPLLGMGAEHEWVLNGSMTDKSMLRNYLGYRLAAQIFPYTPEFVYCEVVIKTRDGYKYQGVYMFGESIKQGKSRVDISEYQSSVVNSSFLIRRDRYDPTGLMLNTYATENQLTYGFIGLRYPNKAKVSPQTVKRIEGEISNIEQILYSDDPLVYASYRQYIDIDSFVDYFIINEFLGNYDAGNNSTYMYKELGGKLKIGPVWDYDGAMDNYSKMPANPEYMAFYTAPLYTRLVKDKYFIEKVEKRYASLRHGLLSEANVVTTIDSITSHLGPAVEREWLRWEAYYAKPNKYSLGEFLYDDGQSYQRDMYRYSNEIYRIKTNLRIHGDVIPLRLKELKSSCVFDTNIKRQNYLFLLVFIVAFFAPLTYISRKK